MRFQKTLICTSLIALAALFAAPFPEAEAQEGKYFSDLPLDGHFGSYRSCYGRAYTGDHLKKHPDQKVADISLSHFPNHQELLGMENAFQPYPDTPRLILELSVRLKQNAPYDPGAIWTEKAFCEPDGDRLHCALECDAGTFFVEGRKNSILMTGGTDLLFTQCDVGDQVLMREPDDKAFELFALPSSHCEPRL